MNRILPVVVALCGACGVDSEATVVAPEAPFAVTSGGLGALPTSPLPDIPSIERDLVLVKANGALSRPHVPPFKTTQDGRLALTNEGKLYVNRPEGLTQHVLDGPPGTSLTSEVGSAQLALSSVVVPLANAALPGASLDMTAMCDPTPNQPRPGQPRNPYPCGPGQRSDCYDVTVVVSLLGPSTSSGALRKALLSGLPVTIEVADPKTPQARIVRAQPGPPSFGPVLSVRDLFEPVVTEDGRLLVTRVSNTDLKWPDDQGTLRSGVSHDTVYSVYDERFAPCDVTRWTQLWPLTHAPYHRAVRSRYGFAKYPFRDPEGNLIADGDRFKGTYPWMDRGGKNVFFTTVAASLYYLDAQGQPRSKYEAACLPGVTCNTQPTLQDIQVMQGTWPYQHMGVAGLWTHGKMVSIDSVLSHLDFPLFSGASQQRMLKLFTPGTGPATVADQSGWVQAGSGRASVLRPLSSSNGEMIESLESLFAFNPNFATRSPRDVVWLMSNGKATDEVEFDDYLDLDTLIFADMRASLTQDDPGYFGNNQRMHYRDGFRYDFAQGWNHRGEGFVGEKRLQNAATTLRLKTPAFGRLTSDPGYSSRIEPMALGGIKGKGLWLDSGSRVTWTLEPQPALTSQDWYVALFVDQRQTFQGDAADLLTFPNGGKVLTFNAQYVGYLSPQNELFFVALPPALAHQDKRYNHYAFALQDGGRRVDFYLNGLLFWTVQDDAPILAMGPGALVLGKSGARQGFRGWVDEVKVVARVPDAELACNHARGSLVGLTGPSPELSRALRYPPSTHAGISQALARRSRPTYAAYACHHDTLAPDGAPRRASVGVRLTQDFRFPEGPLVWSAPRPDSTGNAFCLTCHAAGQVGGLGLGALTRGTTPLIADPRRQPSMWPAFQSGNFPANFLAPGVPASHVTLAPPGVQGFDLWLFK